MIIRLNDLLHLSNEQIKNSKIGLNMEYNNVNFFQEWYESDPNNRNVDFTYNSHYGSGRNFNKIGQLCFGFVRLPDKTNDKWLLVSAGEITSIPDKNNVGACGHVELKEYNGLIGRLVVKYSKGNTFGRYIFNLESIINKIEVLEILPNIYEPIKFDGFEKVHISFKTLKAILEGGRYYDYRAALKGVKAVYCLTDKKTGKLYIGSATGKDGVLQRWEDYKNNMTGGNKMLIALLNANDESYFEKYFEYTLIETFPKSTNDKKILERESYWKDVFKTRDWGYNEN